MLPKALKSFSKCNKLPNMVTLIVCYVTILQLSCQRNLKGTWGYFKSLIKIPNSKMNYLREIKLRSRYVPIIWFLKHIILDSILSYMWCPFSFDTRLRRSVWNLCTLFLNKFNTIKTYLDISMIQTQIFRLEGE